MDWTAFFKWDSLQSISPMSSSWARSCIWWHGDFAQEVEILVGGRTFARKTLRDGFNTLTIEGRFPPGPDGGVLVELKFRYQLLISPVRDHWKTAAYLASLTLD